MSNIDLMIRDLDYRINWQITTNNHFQSIMHGAGKADASEILTEWMRHTTFLPVRVVGKRCSKAVSMYLTERLLNAD